MKEAFQKVKKILSCNALTLLIFELCFRCGGIMLIYPLFSMLLNWSLHRIGYSNITNRNILSFLFHPLTLTILFFALILLLFLFLIEFCSLFVCFEYSRHSMKIRASEMLLCGWKKAIGLLRSRHAEVFLWAFFLMPLLYFPFYVILIHNYQLLRYLFEILFSEKLRGICFAVGVLCFFLLSVLAIFFLPHFLLDQNPSRRLALRLSGKNYLRLLLYLVVWNLLLCLFSAVIFFLLILAGIGYSSLFIRTDLRLSYLLGWKDRCLVILCTITLLVGCINNLALFYMLYVQYREREAGRHYLYDRFENEKDRLRKKNVRIAGISMFVVLVAEIVLFAFVFRIHISTIQGEFVETSVTSHRGGDHSYPENTVAALQDSIDSMTEYAEIDVQETSDGIVILMHDLNLRRTTGINEYVYNITYSEILQQGYEHYTGTSYNTEYVPTLSSVLEMCSEKIKLNIEIKSSKYYNDSLAAKVVSLIETYSSPAQCIISSTNYHYLEQVKELNPDIATGYIMKVAYGDLRDMDAIDFVSVKYSCVTERLVESAHESGKEIHVWTVNSRNAVTRMKGLGVDNIITDNPALVREILARQDDRIGFLELFELFVRD